jgi:sarcosine oxidase subunit alpha
VLLSANRDGLHCALDLLAAGVELAAVVELRPDPDVDLVEQLAAQDVTVWLNSVITKAHGSSRLIGVIVGGAELGEGTGQVRLDKGSQEFISCDLLVVSIGWTPAVGWLYQAKAKLAYDPARREFLPAELPARVHAAGRVTGVHEVRAELLAGKLAGLNAAAEAGFGQKAPADLARQVDRLKDAEPVRTSGLIYVPGNPKKSFISFDEDVSIQDLRDAVAEGYDSMELLKRYSTLSMGPSQGKYESLNTMALCAEANQQPIAETGPTTSRPPVSPVPLGVLAGRIMEPVKQTPMHDWHLAQGATMMNAGLWKRAEHYGDPAAEVIATRAGLGLIDVSTLGKIQIKGPDGPALLERLYTNKWANLRPGQVRYGVMCNEEGVVADDGVAARLEEESWYLTATSGGVAALHENIQWNLQSGWNLKVHLANLTDSYAAMNLTGPRAREALQPLTDIDLSNEAFPYMGVRQGQVAGVPVLILRIGFTGELGYEIHAPAGYGLYLWETLIAAGRPFGITPFGVEAQRIMRLEKGHFIVGQDTDGLTDPLMANLAWAVKLDKPDFVGKPSLVRIEQQGVSQKLVGFEMLDPSLVPEEANQIVVENPAEPVGLEIIGRVTSARYSPTLKKSIGLCWLPADCSQPGARFTVRIRGELHPGRVVPLPFYDPAGEKLRG